MILSLQSKKNHWEFADVSYLKRERMGCVFGTSVVLQKYPSKYIKQKEKKHFVFIVEKKNVLCVKIYHVTE